jgi:hypothetical protein
MLKKDVDYKWTKERNDAFRKNKEVIVKASTLQSPNFEKDFILFTFSFDHSIVVVLTQEDEVGEEFSVSFMSTGLQGVELNYPAIDKQDFVVFKVVKHFLLYILKFHTKVISPHPSVRSLLIQKEPEDKRGSWLTSLQRYDLEIKPTKLVKGQGLCQLAAEALDPHDDDEGWENKEEMLETSSLYACIY